MKIDNQIKVDETYLYGCSSNLSDVANKYKKEEEKKKDTKKTEGVKNEINSTSAERHSLINIEKKKIQDKISIIQIQQSKINQIESTLSSVKSIYLKEKKNKKEEETSLDKITIKKLTKQIKELETDDSGGNQKVKENVKVEEIVIRDKTQKIKIINEILNKIDRIKKELEEKKRKLIYLEGEMLKKQSIVNYNEKNDDAIDIDVNNIVTISGNIDTGITINVNV